MFVIMDALLDLPDSPAADVVPKILLLDQKPFAVSEGPEMAIAYLLANRAVRAAKLPRSFLDRDELQLLGEINCHGSPPRRISALALSDRADGH
jgi:hypothetical protein